MKKSSTDTIAHIDQEVKKHLTMDELQGLFDASKRSPARRKRAKKNKQRNFEAAAAKDKAGLPRWTPSAELKAETARAAAEEHDIVGSPRRAATIDVAAASSNAVFGFEDNEVDVLADTIVSPQPTATRAEPTQSVEIARTQPSRQLNDDASSGGDGRDADGDAERIDAAVNAAADEGRLSDMKRLLSQPPSACNACSSSAVGGQKRTRAEFEHSEDAVDAKMRCR
eukprot:g2178.t1